MAKNIDSHRFKKFITPKEAKELFAIVDEYNTFDKDIKYRIETGLFNENSNIESTGIFYVDMENKQIAGLVFVYKESEILADLETIKDYRNMGIGTNLIKDAINLGAKYLAVIDGNDIAFNLYIKNGFKEYFYDSIEILHYMSLTGLPHPDDMKIIEEKLKQRS